MNWLIKAGCAAIIASNIIMLVAVGVAYPVALISSLAMLGAAFLFIKLDNRP
jgi:hypothetical protein